MINYDPKSWIRLIFHPQQGTIFKLVYPNLFGVMLYTAVWCYLELEVLEWKYEATTTVHSLLGIVLGLFLVFRTNTAYDRWWEGRKLWGALVNNCRTLASKSVTLVQFKSPESRRIIQDLIADFPAALRSHLRQGVDPNQLRYIGHPDTQHLQTWKHQPNAITTELYDRMKRSNSAGDLSNEDLLMIDKELKALTDILGGCERIRKTPIPFSYSLYMKKFIFIYTATLPLALIPLFEYLSVPIIGLVFYILFSVELIAEEIEDPFGEDANDLPTDELAITIAGNVDEIFEWTNSDKKL